MLYLYQNVNNMFKLPRKIKHKKNVFYNKVMTLEGKRYVYRCPETNTILREIKAYSYILYKHKFEIVEK